MARRLAVARAPTSRKAVPGRGPLQGVLEAACCKRAAVTPAFSFTFCWCITDASRVYIWTTLSSKAVGLGEYRERIVSPLRKSASLRTLILGGIFCEYKSIREELFGAIATMKILRELTILGSAAAPSAVLDAVCALLAHTTSLVTLKIPSLAYDEAGATRLVAALRGNKTVQNVSLHGSILHSYAQNGVSSFTHFMANSAQLTSLSLEGVQTDPESTFQDVKWIVAPFHIRENLQSLCLTGFLLNAQCACLFAALVSAKKGCLRRLDLGGCRWIPKSRRERPGDGGATDVQGSGLSVIAHQRCHWIESFDKCARVHLSFLALACPGPRTGTAAASIRHRPYREIAQNHVAEWCSNWTN
ncbi:hypothetical protein MRX96_044545 [Rhipicephalus microplus]